LCLAYARHAWSPWGRMAQVYRRHTPLIEWNMFGGGIRTGGYRYLHACCKHQTYARIPARSSHSVAYRVVQQQWLPCRFLEAARRSRGVIHNNNTAEGAFDIFLSTTLWSAQRVRMNSPSVDELVYGWEEIQSQFGAVRRTEQFVLWPGDVNLENTLV